MWSINLKTTSEREENIKERNVGRRNKENKIGEKKESGREIGMSCGWMVR